MTILEELTVLFYRFGPACTQVWLPAAEFDRLRLGLEREGGPVFAADVPLVNFLFRGRAHVRCSDPRLTEATPR